MTALDQIPVDGIGSGAKKTNYRQVLLTILAGILYCAGWILGRAWLGALIVARWAAHTWPGTAIRVGWADGHKPQLQKR